MGAKALLKLGFEPLLDGGGIERKRADDFEEDLTLAPGETVEIGCSLGYIDADQCVHRGMTTVRSLYPIVSSDTSDMG